MIRTCANCCERRSCELHKRLVNGVVREVWLCLDCAERKSLLGPTEYSIRGYGLVGVNYLPDRLGEALDIGQQTPKRRTE